MFLAWILTFICQRQEPCQPIPPNFGGWQFHPLNLGGQKPLSPGGPEIPRSELKKPYPLLDRNGQILDPEIPRSELKKPYPLMDRNGQKTP